MSKNHSVEPLINGLKNNKNWTLRETSEAFSSFRTMILTYEEILNNATRNLETRTASAMPYKLTIQADPNGSSWERPCTRTGQ